MTYKLVATIHLDLSVSIDDYSLLVMLEVIVFGIGTLCDIVRWMGL
jgi:hypothetical protein